MKKIGLLLVILIGMGVLAWAASDKSDSPRLLTDKRDLQEFDKIHFTGKGNVFLQQGDHEVIQIVAEESLLPYITSEVKDGTLEIGEKSLGWFYSLKSFEPYQVYITAKEVKEVSLAGKGMLVSEKGIKGKSLSLNVSGSGKVDCALDVEDLIANITGSGDFELKGKASQQEITISGTGTYKALKLLGTSAKVDIRGFGDVSLNVQDKLDISISGKGAVTYMGNPKISQKILGTGKIEQLK